MVQEGLCEPRFSPAQGRCSADTSRMKPEVCLGPGPLTRALQFTTSNAHHSLWRARSGLRPILQLGEVKLSEVTRWPGRQLNDPLGFPRAHACVHMCTHTHTDALGGTLELKPCGPSNPARAGAPGASLDPATLPGQGAPGASQSAIGLKQVTVTLGS